MGINIKKWFGKKREPTEELEYDELEDSENPEAIREAAIEKAGIPKGTSIEPKVLIGVGTVLFFIIGFVIAYGLQDPTPKTAQEKAEEQFKKTHSSGGGALPEELNKMPGSYGTSLKDQANKNQKNGTATNSDPNLLAARYSSSQPQIYDRGYSSITTRPSLPSTPSFGATPYSSISNEDREVSAARKSGIRFSIQSAITALTGKELPATAAAATMPVAATPVSAGQPSDQDQKVKFLSQNQTSSSFYLHSQLQAPVSEFQVQAGTIIPGVLITGINSDLPGQIVGQVRENVYDSVTGDYLLIPYGTKIIGTYDSNMAYGQDRVLVVWNRLILPNGASMDLEGMVGADMSGYSGFSGRKNDHIPRLLNGVILGSILTAGARVATGGASDALTYSQLVGQGVAENIAQAAAQITEKNLNIQPTIEIQPGYPFNVFVNKDMVLRPYSG